MITRLEAGRYRCFAQLDVGLAPYSVLAGPNGSGKTTLLDLPVLFGDLLRARYASAAFLEPRREGLAPRARTLRELIHQERGDYFGLAVEAQLPEDVAGALAREAFSSGRGRSLDPTHMRYETRFEVFNETRLQVTVEKLSLFAGEGSGKTRRRGERFVLGREGGAEPVIRADHVRRGRPYNFRIPAEQLALSSIPYDTDNFPATNWFRDFLQEETVFYEPEWERLRQASPPGMSASVTSNALNLPWLALSLQQNEPKRFENWVRHVRTALPRVASIEAREREEDHHAYFKVEYRGEYPVTSSGLSDGTLRILALTLLPYLTRSQLPALLVTEEPENGIHPRAIEAVLQSLNSIYGSRVWISTHSPIVLANTRLDCVFAMRLGRDGSVEVVRGDRHPNLADWQGGIDIGSLFAAGVLG